MSRLPAGIDEVYIKPEENKAYWVKGKKTGDTVYVAYTGSANEGEDVICSLSAGIHIKRMGENEVYSLNKDYPCKGPGIKRKSMEGYTQLQLFDMPDPRLPVTVTWNPWHGCTKVSPGCAYCYMYRRDERIGRNPSIVEKTKSFRTPARLPSSSAQT